MQQYVDQLLEDLQNAKRVELPLSEEQKPQSFEEHIAEVERWLESEPQYTFSYHCGIQRDAFPPADRLSHEQITALVKAFYQLLFSWNIMVDIPEELEIGKAYSLIVEVLDRKVEIVESGFVDVEFCTYDLPSCPFGEYCMCKKYDTDNDMDIDNHNISNELPF